MMISPKQFKDFLYDLAITSKDFAKDQESETLVFVGSQEKEVLDETVDD